MLKGLINCTAGTAVLSINKESRVLHGSADSVFLTLKERFASIQSQAVDLLADLSFAALHSLSKSTPKAQYKH